MDAALQTSLYSAAAALCVFSAGLLRDRRTRLARIPDFFTLFLMLEALGFTLELLMVHPATPLKGLWLALRMGTSLLVGPCLWLTVKETIDGVRPRLSDLGRGHGLAVAAGFLLLLPLAQSAHLGTTYADPHRFIGALHSRVIHGTMLGCIAIFGVQVPFYLGRGRRLLLAHFRRSHPASAGRHAGAMAWLHLPFVAVLTTWALGLLRTVQCATHAPHGFTVLFALTDVTVTTGAIYLIVRRAAVRPAPAEFAVPADPTPVRPPIAEVSTPPEPAAPLPAGPAADAKYARSRLPAAVRVRIKHKLESDPVTAALYRDSLLNLRSLSQAIKEKAHYVSQVINQDLGTTFYELVNRHRIAQARQLLVDSPERTILEIALSVGFNSKSTFNTAFRRHAGTTPSDFRATHAR